MNVRVRSVLRLVVVAMAVVALLAATPAYAKSQNSKNKNKNKTSAPTKQQIKFEKDFLKKMIDRHQRGIQIAKWIDQNTSVTDLNAICELFIEREQQELIAMKDALLDWYGISYTPKTKPLGGDDCEDLCGIDSEAEFVIAALEFFIGYEKNEIAQMKQVARKAYHADMKTFAADIIAINKADISVLKELIEEVERLNGIDDDQEEDKD